MSAAPVSGGPTSPAPDGPVWPVRLATHVWNPNGPAGLALLLHGLGTDGTTMWRLASRLADRGYLVAAPDLRSHGRSPVAADHRIEALTEDVAALGTSWDLLIGHSLGGAVAAHLLGRGDVEVSRALLLDPVLELDPSARELVRAVQRAEVGRLDAAAVAAAHPRWSPMDVDRKVLAAALCGPDVVDRVIDHNPTWDLAAIHGSWRTRVHLLAADPALGALLRPETVAQLADGDRITSTTVAGAGHSLHRDDPDAVLAAIDALLEAPR